MRSARKKVLKRLDDHHLMPYINAMGRTVRPSNRRNIMQRYALIESNTGYVWGVVNAETALAACAECDRQAYGGPVCEGAYEYADVGDRHTYDVRIAPEGFDVQDGQDSDAIAAVDAMPRADLFVWVPAE